MAMQMDWMGHHRIVDEDDARALVAFETDRFDAFAEFFAIERPHEAFHVAGEMNLARALRRARVRVRSERHEVAVGQHLVANILRSEERRVGTSVSVRVDLGGRRIIKKQNINQTTVYNN